MRHKPKCKWIFFLSFALLVSCISNCWCFPREYLCSNVTRIECQPRAAYCQKKKNNIWTTCISLLAMCIMFNKIRHRSVVFHIWIDIFVWVWRFSSLHSFKTRVTFIRFQNVRFQHKNRISRNQIPNICMQFHCWHKPIVMWTFPFHFTLQCWL